MADTPAGMGTPVLLAVLAAAMMHAGWNALIRGAPDKALYTCLLYTSPSPRD